MDATGTYAKTTPRRRAVGGLPLPCPVTGAPEYGATCLRCVHGSEGTGGMVGCDVEESVGAYREGTECPEGFRLRPPAEAAFLEAVKAAGLRLELPLAGEALMLLALQVLPFARSRAEHSEAFTGAACLLWHSRRGDPIQIGGETA